MSENFNNAVVEYETDNGKVKLSPSIIKKYLVSGGGDVSDSEVTMFLQLCKYQGLNPFLREAYLIKFGSSPATIVTGKEVFTKRASKNEKFDGMEAGVIVQKADKSLEYRNGALVLSDETLVGGWAKIYRKDYRVPIDGVASIKEYQRFKRDGTLQANWKDMPATMIRKVALVQALREAFPDEFQGLYSQEEMPIDNTRLNEKPIEIIECAKSYHQETEIETDFIENEIDLTEIPECLK